MRSKDGLSRHRQKTGLVALLGMLLLVCNLALAACGDVSPTAVGATTGQIIPALGLPTATGGANNTTTTSNANPTPTQAANNNLPTVTAGDVNTTQVVVTTQAANTAVVAPTPTSGQTNAPTATPLPSVQKYNPVFASYQESPVSVQPAVKPYAVAADLGNVTNLGDFTLSDQEKQLIAKNDFVIEPAQFNQFFQAYESYRYDQVPTFVSSDSVLHVYHLIFDKILRTTESNYLIKDLTQLNSTLYDYLSKQYTTLKGSNLDEAAKRALAFVAVARKLNAPSTAFNIPTEIQAMVDQELQLIAAAQGKAPSPVMGGDYAEDYGQYTPRGHYTRTPELQQYFKSMIWYGRMDFRLKNDSETQSALLLAQAISSASANGRKASDLWDLIYEPTTFFVGNADDLTYIDYMNLAKAVWGPSALTDSKVFGDAAKLAVFKKATDALPPPKINSMFTRTDTAESRDEQTKGFRVMGQRFVIDAYVFQQLIWRAVGTQDKPRLLPKALDFFAALGSSEALNTLTSLNENQYANYDTQMQQTKGQLANLNTDTWTQNLYWAWLYNLRPFVQKYGQGYPNFMQSQAWQDKMLLTGLGSFTELKHDTILYAKQVLAEKGGGPEDLPLGYVEPIPTFYARMSALLKMTKNGLAQRNILDKDIGATIDTMQKDVDILQAVAVKELSNQPISDTEKDFIAYWGANIETITYAAADTDPNGQGTKILDDVDASVVADIASDPDGKVLEEATGHPSIIYVAVSLNGKVVLTEGAVYSQYEFLSNSANRLTDEQWHQLLKDGKTPPLEAWKQRIIAAGVAKHN
jgi:hypothetical protein